MITWNRIFQHWTGLSTIKPVKLHKLYQQGQPIGNYLTTIEALTKLENFFYKIDPIPILSQHQVLRMASLSLDCGSEAASKWFCCVLDCIDLISHLPHQHARGASHK